ncbi:MAG: hypothetical protein JMDDDDMK_04779 [Acidobacteria bacterium]|nr:hypothetical protein [Acidobacteriota bacterium]
MKWFAAQSSEIFVKLLNARFVADRRVREGAAGPWFGRVFAARSVNVIKILGLRVIRLEVFVRERPRGRDAVVMANLAEIFLAQSEQRRAVKFGVAADVIVRVRMQRPAIPVVPDFFRVVFRFDVDGARFPIVFLARHESAAFEQQNSFARRREFVRERPAARARADDDHVVMVRVRHKFLLARSCSLLRLNPFSPRENSAKRKYRLLLRPLRPPSARPLWRG